MHGQNRKPGFIKGDRNLRSPISSGPYALRAVASVTTDERAAADLDRQAFAGLRELAWRAARRKRNDYRPVAADYRRLIQATRSGLDHAAIQEVIGQHGYTHTVLMRLLDEARRGGVLPPALFTWLKGVDEVVKEHRKALYDTWLK